MSKPHYVIKDFSIHHITLYLIRAFSIHRYTRDVRNAYFYLETSNFKLAQKYSFHALEVLPVARNAKFQPMFPLLEGVTVRWFGHSNKVLMNGRSKCLSGLVLPPSKECFQFRKQKEFTWGKVWGIRGVRQNSYFFFLQKRRNYCGGMSWGIVM